MSEAPRCVCCGQSLPADMTTVWDIHARTFTCAAGSVRLSREAALFFDALWRHRSRGPLPTLEAMLDVVYANDSSGGHESFETARVQISKLRALLRPLNYTITKNHGRSGGAGYRLVKVVP